MEKYLKVKKGDIWIYSSNKNQNDKYKILSVNKNKLRVKLLCLSDDEYNGKINKDYELEHFNLSFWRRYKENNWFKNINYRFLKG